MVAPDNTAASPPRGDAASRLSEVLPGFSYPQPLYADALDSLVPVIVHEYAAGLASAYLGRIAATIERSSQDLVAYLSSWVAAPLESVGDRRVGTPVPGWDYAFGDAYRTLMNVGGNHTWVSASIAAHLGACGVPGSWSIHLEEPFRMRWGNWLLPPAEYLSVKAESTSALVEYAGPGGSGEASFFVSDNQWNATGARELGRVGTHGINFTVLVSDALTMRDYEDLTDRAVSSLDPMIFRVFTEAIDILDEYTPQYLPWVARTLHQLFLLTPRPGKVESGSVEHYLGLVHLTAHGEPLPVAELLVHEATHQYMNVLAKLGPLDDGTDEQMYWSPAVETVRPVSKIVAAFHAFGNVLLFYRWCRENGLANRKECDRQEALLGGWMRDLIPPVTDNPALTETGNALCKPLLERLRDSS